MNSDYKSFENDYLLLDEILRVLYRMGLNIRGNGTKEEGFVPIYEFQVETCRLHFGTLSGLLNTPEKYKPKAGDINYWQNVVLKINEIDEIKYKLIDIAEAIEVLAESDEVKKEVGGKWLDLNSKIISLTKNGVGSYNTKKYQKLVEKERSEKIIFESTKSTNFWMKAFTGTLAIASLATITLQLATCNNTKPALREFIILPPSQTNGINTQAISAHSDAPNTSIGNAPKISLKKTIK